jgi:hypothetical protein
MKKTKIYLDTSVISHLDAPDTPEKMGDTHRSALGKNSRREI